MKNLDFKPAKSTEDFRSNYKLHDIAEFNGKNLLVQWGFKCSDFGEDNRYKKVWEKGEDKRRYRVNLLEFKKLRYGRRFTQLTQSLIEKLCHPKPSLRYTVDQAL